MSRRHSHFLENRQKTLGNGNKRVLKVAGHETPTLLRYLILSTVPCSSGTKQYDRTFAPIDRKHTRTPITNGKYKQTEG